ncbi:tetrapyrrole methylase [Colletotrichum graminicola M1.001]|uniref:precorrin-2 dehydrogenase n=1 Tax=Colletotrichum graminicola (strain M1.001 / M2 / FGSC 10212) TaxID=645133 RepID=E3QP10_COLGM|nr:tetrapyrrole methylase [Colletotrichum graminicola M1.001]EFQ32598.1 tetrapyrrole methylase [Colletotrichum graminicola M1.001]
MATTTTTATTITSLLAALNCKGDTHLIIGTNPLAAARCTQSLAAGATTILLAPDTSDLHYGLQKRVDAGEVTWHKKAFEDADLFTLGRDEVDNFVDAVFITSGPRDPLAAHISALCRRNRIPVNVVDAPHLCSFSLLSTHTDGPLQIGVTTNGRGCKLASRIRREVAAALPKGLGAACARLGDVRRRIQTEDHLSAQPDEADDSLDQTASFNKLVTEADLDAAKNRRMRWLSQVCEYWPLKRLAAIDENDVESVLKSYAGNSNALPEAAKPPPAPAGLGSGASSPVAASSSSSSSILSLSAQNTECNADQAQEELHELALAGAKEGKTVLRLKQGDPFIYGRGGEEVAYFREHGFGDRVTVLPGITSSLSAPLFAGIPPTQRDVADQVLVCTGTGKKGKPPAPPGFVATRTVVFLMALHRITGLVRELTCYLETEEPEAAEGRGGGEVKETPKRALWPPSTPCAVIERASCPDQRVIRTTLEHVAEAIETEGSRPPGLLVVGRACEALYEREKGRAWAVEDGFKGFDFDELLGLS